MLAKPHALRFALLLGVALGGAAGCLIVAPLDDLPAASGKTGAGGKSAGGHPTIGAAAGQLAMGGEAAGEGGEGASAGASGDGQQCQTNAQCVQRNADLPYRCRPSDHTCVPLRSDSCVTVNGDFKDPNAVYFGAFASLNAAAPADSDIVWSHSLALDELGKKGGIPGAASGSRRPLVMIVCDNADDFVDAGLAHLADEVEVPAVIATLKPDDLQRGFSTYRTHHDIFYLDPVTITKSLVTQPDDNLVWSLLGQPSDMAPTYAALLNLQENRLRDDTVKFPTERELKVTLVTTKTGFDGELSRAVEPLLRFNGANTEANVGNYQFVNLDPATVDIEETAQAIGAFGPDVVISAASELFSMDDGLLKMLESVWGTAQPGKPRPFYILSPYNAGDLDGIVDMMNDDISFAVDENPQLRFVGVSVAGPRDNTLQNAYTGRLHKLFPDAFYDTANYYDATYYLAYAMFAAGNDAELSGSRIAQGMTRLLTGDNLNIGPSNIDATFAALSSAGSTVHVGSTYGPPDFDPETGVRPVEGGVLCFQKSGFKVQQRSDVLRYDATDGALTGTFPCFSNFFP